MLTRLAFFEGTIRSGREADFDRYVRETLVPIWRQTLASACRRRRLRTGVILNLIPKPRRQLKNAPGKGLIQPSCRLPAKCANRRSEDFVQRPAIRIGDLQNHRETMCVVIRLDLAHDLDAQRM